MQMRICDCLLRVGGCFCEIKTETDDKRTVQDIDRSNKSSKQVL